MPMGIKMSSTCCGRIQIRVLEDFRECWMICVDSELPPTIDSTQSIFERRLWRDRVLNWLQKFFDF